MQQIWEWSLQGKLEWRMEPARYFPPYPFFFFSLCTELFSIKSILFLGDCTHYEKHSVTLTLARIRPMQPRQCQAHPAWLWVFYRLTFHLHYFIEVDTVYNFILAIGQIVVYCWWSGRYCRHRQKCKRRVIHPRRLRRWLLNLFAKFIVKDRRCLCIHLGCHRNNILHHS